MKFSEKPVFPNCLLDLIETTFQDEMLLNLNLNVIYF